MKKHLLTLALAAPAITFGTSGTVDTLITSIGTWIGSLTPIAFALALLFFFYGLAMFILKSGDDKASGRSIMLWGIGAIFVMASIFGIVKFLQNSLQIQGDGSITVPKVTL